MAMNSERLTRRRFSLALTSALPGFALSAGARASIGAPDSEEVRKTEEAIHQEVLLKASRKRVYDALIEADQFRKATGGAAAEISREVGGAFSLLDGHNQGPALALGATARIVPAW